MVVSMRFMTSRELRNNPLWQSKTSEETIITVNGKPKAIVIEVENEDIEEQLRVIRRAKAQSSLDKLRMYSVDQGFNKLTDEEILAEIKRARKQNNPA